MSKSLGNTITVHELLEEGLGPAAIRHQLLGAQYRRELNFTREGLDASAAAVQRLLDFEARLAETVGVGGVDGAGNRPPAADGGAPATATAESGGLAGPLARLADEAVEAFRAALEDDLNSAEALAALFVFVNRVNGELDAAAEVAECDLEAAKGALASMAEVMTAQYIRTARLKGLSFPAVVLKHALRNALIAPFTVIMLQFPWLPTGVVIVEVMFRYQGFGWILVEAAGNNDIDLLLSCSLVSVVVVLVTQLISDVGYAYLNPRIRVQ